MEFFNRSNSLLSDEQVKKYIKMGPNHNLWLHETISMVGYLGMICELEKRTSEEYVTLFLTELKINVPYRSIAKIVKSYNILEICTVFSIIAGVILWLSGINEMLIPVVILFGILMILDTINEVYIRKLIRAIKKDMKI